MNNIFKSKVLGKYEHLLASGSWVKILTLPVGRGDGILIILLASSLGATIQGWKWERTFFWIFGEREMGNVYQALFDSWKSKTIEMIMGDGRNLVPGLEQKGSCFPNEWNKREERELLKIHRRLRCCRWYAERADTEALLGNLLCRRAASSLCFSDDLDFYSCSWFLNFLEKVQADRIVMKSASKPRVSKDPVHSSSS